MNPYQSPEPAKLDKQTGTLKSTLELGPPCPSCGSVNTSKDSVLRSSPSILAVIFFGWIFMLARGAFAMRSSTCRDCGEMNRYKSGGSWAALVVFVSLILLIVGSILTGA